MHNTVKNLLDIEKNIKIYLNKLNINNNPKIIAVSKTFKLDNILPLIEHGHIILEKIKFRRQLKSGQRLKKQIQK